MKVEFKFDIDQWVVTPFGKRGIVEMASIDNNRQPSYFVKCESNCVWFKEAELTAAQG